MTSSDADRSAESTGDRRTVCQSLEEYGRGVAGGLLFSLPFLYTMEIWWAGFLIKPAYLLVYMAVTFLLLLGYNRFAGMRRDANFLEVCIDSVEEMGLGLLLAAVVLLLIDQIHPAMTPLEIMGKIVVESMTIAVGVSVGTAQLGANGADAKTGLSLLVGAVVLFFSDFRGADRQVHRDGSFAMLLALVTSYCAALFASALMLWFFQRFDDVPLLIAVAQVIVLAFPAMLGASAGRLLIQ